jgi:hypothetical protein
VPHRLLSTYQAFEQRVNRVRQLALGTRRLRTEQGTPLHIRDQEETVSLCLLKLMLAWEAFLEEAFLKYMCGAASAAAHYPPLMAARERSTASAYVRILGRSRYLSWSRHELDQRARLHFVGGVPFSLPAAAAAAALDEMVAVRNRVAHRSQHATQEFRTVVRTQIGYFPKGMTPGRFLMMQSSGVMTLELYAVNLLATARLISHH